jgi:hypothetical protein
MASESYPLRLDKALMKKLRERASSEQRTVASLIRLAIVTFLDKRVGH